MNRTRLYPPANEISCFRFSILLAQAGAAGLTDALSQPGPFTVFAPTNEAFGKIPKEQLDALVADPAALKQVGVEETKYLKVKEYICKTYSWIFFCSDCPAAHIGRNSV